MKRKLLWCLPGLILLVSVAWSQDKKADIGTQKVVTALEQQWLHSEATNNPDLLAPLLADQFVNTDNDGKVMNKAETIADTKATKFDSATYDDVKVTAFGDVAVATGVFKAKGTDSSGKPFDYQERFTDTWVKMPNGKWQCVASHQSLVKT